MKIIKHSATDFCKTHAETRSQHDNFIVEGCTKILYFAKPTFKPLETVSFLVKYLIADRMGQINTYKSFETIQHESMSMFGCHWYATPVNKSSSSHNNSSNDSTSNFTAQNLSSLSFYTCMKGGSELIGWPSSLIETPRADGLHSNICDCSDPMADICLRRCPIHPIIRPLPNSIVLIPAPMRSRTNYRTGQCPSILIHHHRHTVAAAPLLSSLTEET